MRRRTSRRKPARHLETQHSWSSSRRVERRLVVGAAVDGALLGAAEHGVGVVLGAEEARQVDAGHAAQRERDRARGQEAGHLQRLRLAAPSRLSALYQVMFSS